jgi:hypothetical protein
MRAHLLICFALFLTSGGFAVAQTTPAEKASQPKFDPCSLIQKNEVESVRGATIKDTKASERTDGDFRMSQCFYTAAEFSQSVNVTVFQKHPEPGKRSPTEFWKHTFDRFADEETREKKKNKEEEAKAGREEEEGAPPRRIPRVGEDAYWAANRFGGTLYVLKKDTIFSISIGGTDPEEVKIDKSKKLALKAVARL